MAAPLDRIRRWPVGRFAPLLLAAGAAALAAATGRTGTALGLVIAAVLSFVLVAVGVPLDVWVREVARRVAEVIAGGCAVAVWLLMYLGALLAGRGRGGTEFSLGRERRRWRSAPTPELGSARHMFAPAAGSGRSPRNARSFIVATFAVVGLLAVALGGAKWLARHVVPEDWLGPDIEFPEWAFPDEEWVSSLHEAGWPVRFHPALGWQSDDVASQYLNVRDGVRRSWRSGQRVDDVPVVWFLGGSTMYGLGQRDEYTIPSHVSRLAARDGHPIEAVNLGVPGYNQWQTNALMGFRLSRGQRPDLIVVYDGANDLHSMEYRASEGMEPLEEPPHRFHEAAEQQLNYRPEPRSGDSASEEELRQAFTEMYTAGVELADRTARAFDVPLLLAWQPIFLSMSPAADDAPVVDAFPFLADDQSVVARDRLGEIRRRLDPRVVDLGGALDDAPRPVFYDPVHTNEEGARIVAQELWALISDRFEVRDRAAASNGP